MAQNTKQSFTMPGDSGSIPSVAMEHLLTGACTEKTKINQKEAGNGIFVTFTSQGRTSPIVTDQPSSFQNTLRS